MPRTQNNERAEQLRELASMIARKASANIEIAQGFRLIADAMEPCVDCGRDTAPDGGDSGMGGTD